MVLEFIRLKNQISLAKVLIKGLKRCKIDCRVIFRNVLLDYFSSKVNLKSLSKFSILRVDSNENSDFLSKSFD